MGTTTNDRRDGLPPRPIDMAAPRSAVDLPSHHDLLPQLGRLLDENGYLSVVLVDVSEVGKIARRRGSQTYIRLMDLMGQEFARLRGNELRHEDLVSLSEKAGEAFLLYLAPRARPELPSPESLSIIAERIRSALSQRLSTLSISSAGGRVDVGFSFVLHNPLLPHEWLIQRGVEEARNIVRLEREYREARDKHKIQHIIMTENVRTLFQPIVDLKSGEVHGFEALARGPRGTDLESPLALFETASKADLLFEIDQLCRRKAVLESGGLESPMKLFLNTLPFSIRDPHFRGKYLLDLLDGSGLVPERIVLEVTETVAIEDYTAYLDEKRYFSDMGFLSAIDDMGVGYSGVEKLVHLEPDYVKLDIHLVRGIDSSTIKRDIVQAFCGMAKKIGAKLVAEGVETRKELGTVRELGIDYAQGFLLARPSPTFQTEIHLDP